METNERMKFFIATLAMFSMLTSASAQDNHVYTPADARTGVVKEPEVSDEIGLYANLEREAGWLRNNYRNHTTPAHEVDATIRFVVERDGSNSNIKIVLVSNQREIQSTYIKQELIRLFRLMPKWSPATKNGSPVRFQKEMTVALESRTDKQAREKEFKIAREKAKIAREEDNKIYDVVDVNPCFMGVSRKFGGDRILSDWIYENRRYPQAAKEKGIKGRVIVTFVIEKNGSVSNVEIVKSLSPECDAEAIRLIKSMPKWESGKKDGAPVRVRYTLPVIFSNNKEACLLASLFMLGTGAITGAAHATGR